MAEKETPAPRSLLAGDSFTKAVAAEQELRLAHADQDLVTTEIPEGGELGFWKLALLRFLRHRVATVSLAILATIAVLPIFVPILPGNLSGDAHYRNTYVARFRF